MVPSMSNGLVVSVVCFKPPGFLLSKDNCEAGRPAHRAPLISGDLQSFERARNDSKEGTKEFGEFDGEFDGEFSLLFSNSTQDHNGQETGDRRPDAARRWPM